MHYSLQKIEIKDRKYKQWKQDSIDPGSNRDQA